MQKLCFFPLKELSIWSYINQGTINVLYIVLRVGNLLIGFSSDSLDFCERKSDSLVKRANRSHHSLVVSNLSEALTVLLGIKRGKLSKTPEKYEFFVQFTRFCERFARITS